MRRRTMLFLLIGAAMPLAVASTAWACGVLAPLSLNTTVAAPGATVTATGKNYTASAADGPVQIHLDTRTGPVLATVPNTSVSSSGAMSTSFQVPAGTSPGWYVVLATQYVTATGAPKSGTPGRTTLRVSATGTKRDSRRHGAIVSPWGSAKPTGPAASAATGSSGPAPLTLLLAIVMSLGLLTGGLTLAGRRSAASHRPQLGL